MYNKTALDYIFDVKESAVHILTSRYQVLAMAVGVLLLAPWGRKMWMKVVHVLMFLEGLWLCFGDVRGTFVGSNLWENPEKFDGTHVLLSRFVGLLMIVRVLHYFLLNTSTDNTVETSILWSYVILLCTAGIALAYTLTHPSKKSKVLKMHEDVKELWVLSALLVTPISCFYLLRSTDWSGYGETRSHANFHLRVEFFFLFFSGLVMFVVPQVPIKYILGVQAIDPVHAYLMRCCGCLVLSQAILVCRAANFLWQNAKDSIILVNLLVYMFLAGVSWYSMYLQRANISYQEAGIRSVVNIFMMMNAFGALDRDVTCFERIIGARLKEVNDDVKILKNKYL